jgi:glycosyltransferase involved in cell wall biosynthesis
MPRKILFLAPVLPVDVLATASILEKAELLESLITRGVATENLRGLLPRSTITQSFFRRPVSPVAKDRTEAKWTADLVFYLMLALTRSRTRATDASFAFLDRRASRRTKPSLGAVFAREDCCLRTFRRARQAGVTTIYQLPTAYWRSVHEMMQRELAEFPNICKAASDPNEFAEQRTTRKDAELDSADHVLCPSTFVRESLMRRGAGTYEMIPFAINATPALSTEGSRKPMFLYAGNITMRKGVHRLLLAWKELKAHRTHELRLIGDMFLSAKFLKDFQGMFTHVPRLEREKLDQRYREAAAFVFNPVADGFGHVILEAMRCGTPVIASRHCGAPDTITNRVEGLLVDYGDQSQLISALDLALSNPAELREMGRAAADRARKYTWEDYGERFLNWLRPLLKHE